MAGAPVVEVKGKVSEVRIGRGQGMPSIVLKSAGEESVIFLGPMRYLLAQNLNPKVGDEMAAKVYRTANGLFAASVTLLEGNRTIRLRDESGRPMWRGGPRW